MCTTDVQYIMCMHAKHVQNVNIAQTLSSARIVLQEEQLVGTSAKLGC
jgi:hypothetical protein